MIKTLLSLSAAILLFTACSKDGEQGPEGQQGQQGQQGPKGDKGEDGTANVVSSNWIPWKAWTGTSGSTYRDAVYVIPENMLSAVDAADFRTFLSNGGTFLLYVLNDASANLGFHPVPGNVTNNAGQVQYSFSWNTATVAPHSFRFIVHAAPDNTLPTAIINRTNYSLRYVLIPAGKVVTANRQKVDWSTMSYDQVANLLGFED